MERSSRFLSLSGLSGVLAGMFAIAGAVTAYLFLRLDRFPMQQYYEPLLPNNMGRIDHQLVFVLADAAFVLIASLMAGYILTSIKARRLGQKVSGPLARRMLVNLIIPLVTGGLFCVALFYHGLIWLIAPTTLLFYGLALINASKYTFDELRYLGIVEIVLGIIACFWVGYGLIFWTIGFGLLHIIYGIFMYLKYERVR